MYDVAIIGAGVIGGLIARELSKYKLNIVILEKENDVSNGTTKANSAIIHAGYDAQYGTNKAKFNALGNPMFDKLCRELDVSFKRVGSLVVAFNDEDVKVLKRLYDNGDMLGIPDIQIISGNEARLRETALSDEIIAALYAPTAGIINPWELTIGAIENAMDNGAKLRLNYRVDKIEKDEDSFCIYDSDSHKVKSKLIINCAGVFADNINDMVSERKISIIPKKGQYLLLDKQINQAINSVIFQCPTYRGKGVLMTPTVDGNLLIGPDSITIGDKEDTITTNNSISYIRESANRICKSIPLDRVITSFAGLRAEPSTDDFIIGETRDVSGFINVAGIKSPGLSAAPAIAVHVVDIVKSIIGTLSTNQNFRPYRRRVMRFHTLTDMERSEVIKKDSRYGRIICRCENVTEGEIVDCIHRNCGGRTVDGVKKRTRPGMGRCQGGFCLPLVMEILARELNIDVKEVVKDDLSSYILTDETKSKCLYR